MAKQRRTRDATTEEMIPTASTADIAFLLIIYFMLTMAMIVTMGFKTEMPAGQKSEQPPEKTTTVQLHDDQIRLNDELMDIQKLRESLLAMKFENKKGNDKIVLMEATGNVQYQDYFAVMAAITGAKAHLVIVQEEEEEAKEEKAK
jgi:biopolymer transport protein ExbD